MDLERRTVAFVRDGGEQRRELQERYGYSFWMDGMWVLDG